MDGARPKTIQWERGGFAIALLGPRRQCGVWECLVMSMWGLNKMWKQTKGLLSHHPIHTLSCSHCNANTQQGLFLGPGGCCHLWLACLQRIYFYFLSSSLSLSIYVYIERERGIDSLQLHHTNTEPLCRLLWKYDNFLPKPW